MATGGVTQRQNLFDLPCASSSTSVTCSKPFTSVTEGMPELSSVFSLFAVAPMQPDVSGFALLPITEFFVKIRSAPCKKVLCELPHPSLVHLRGCGHCLKE